MSKLNEETLDVLDFLMDFCKNGTTYHFEDVEFKRMYDRAVLLRDYHQALRNIEECRRDEEVFNGSSRHLHGHDRAARDHADTHACPGLR